MRWVALAIGGVAAAGLAFVGLCGCTAGVRAQIYSAALQDNGDFAPFEMAPGLYYVGASDIAVFAVGGPDGLVVIDAGYEATGPRVIANLKRLGFEPHQVKLILNTHAHMDHAAGLALLKRETGAPLYASVKDAKLLEAGGRGDFFLGDWMTYPKVVVDRRLSDGEVVEAGGVKLTAHITPGHTKGCTSWSFDVTVDGAVKHALVICSLSTLQYRLMGNAAYPEIASDFAQTFERLRSLPCEVFLGAHGKFFDLKAKRARQMAGATPNPFVDPAGCQAFMAREEAAFRRKLKRQGG